MPWKCQTWKRDVQVYYVSKSEVFDHLEGLGAVRKVLAMMYTA